MNEQRDPPGERPAKAKVLLRLDAGLLRRIDGRARLEKRTRSNTIRLMLDYAIEHMPQGWVR